MNQRSTVSFFRSRPLLWTLAGLWVLSCSCSEELPEPLFTNSVIQGLVQYYYTSDGPYENISVTAQGPYQDQTTLTNTSGLFEINGLGNGTYNLEISKEGFGTKYHYGIQLFGNDTVICNDQIYQLMTGAKLPVLYEIHTRTSYDWLNATSIAITTNRSTSSYTQDLPVRVFMADFEDVSYKNYQCTRRANALWRNGFDKLLFTVWDLPFESRKEIFLIAYICNPFEEGYLNSYTGLWTFSTLEPEERSGVMNFTMPSP